MRRRVMDGALPMRVGDTRAGNRPGVALIGFQKMGNLGLGYLSAVLREAGFRVEVIDIEAPPEEISARVLARRPILVGFSLIFHFYIRRTPQMIGQLRHAGPHAHFPMGRHYPTLSSGGTPKA